VYFLNAVLNVDLELKPISYAMARIVICCLAGSMSLCFASAIRKELMSS